MKRFILLSAATATLLCLGRPLQSAPTGVPAAPIALPQPKTEVGGYPIRIDRIDQYQELTLDLAEPADRAPGAPERQSAVHRVGLEMRVLATGAAAAALDRFEGPLRAETDRGQAIEIPSTGFAIGRDGGLLAVDSDDVDLQARSLRVLRGTLRVFPKGEAFRLSLEGKVGAEGKHSSGLTVRVKRLMLRDGRALIELETGWPATVAPRGAADGEAFSVGVEGPNFSHEPIPSSRETLNGGKEERRNGGEEVGGRDGWTTSLVETELGGLRGSVQTVVLEGILHLGKPILHPFVLKNIPLPLPYSYIQRPRAPVAVTPAAQHRVLIDDKPAGRGNLDVGVSTWTGPAWGPWRWSRVPTDEAGLGNAAFPGPGKYRIQRRWSPLLTSDATRLMGATWRGGTFEITVVAGKALTLPVLAATGAGPPTSAGTPTGYRVSVPTGADTYTIRATRVRQIGRALISFVREGTVQVTKPNRMVFVNLEVTAADRRRLSALAGLAINGGVDSDDRPLELPSDPQSPSLPVGDQPMLMTVVFIRVHPDCRDLREVVGELAASEGFVAETLEIPLADAPVTEYRRDDLRFRVDVSKQATAWRYTVELRSPDGGVMSVARDRGESPALLDADHKVLPLGVTGVQSPPEQPTKSTVSFTPPADGQSTPPAFLRLPIRARFGELKRYPFRLTAIPLPVTGR